MRLTSKSRRTELPRPVGAVPPEPAPRASSALAPTVSPSELASAAPRKYFSRGNVVRGIAATAAAVAAGWVLVPWAILSWNTISTDDAYVDGHVTFVAPRISGQVARVLVDDNMRVKRGDVLVEIDPEPFQAQVDIDEARVTIARADLVAARAQAEAFVSQARGAYFELEHAVEEVRNQLAVLQSNIAQVNVEQAALTHAERDLTRNLPLAEKKIVSQADLDLYTARRDEARSRLASAKLIVQETRATLGLPANEARPLDVPADLVENYSLVRSAVSTLQQILAELGSAPGSVKQEGTSPLDPSLIAAVIHGEAPHANGAKLEAAYGRLAAKAPIVVQAEAKLQQAQRDLDLAKLNLSYCKVVSEIDGVVTRRNVNAGNFVQSGQNVMAVRSLREIWISANFKETQLADLRIGQRVRLHTDMYGRRREFTGRITGFTMGTGQTLALLPPQNATGNFIKIVQRLPVRIELTNYDPEAAPLFVGISVVPYVYFREPPTGPHAGDVLQPQKDLPTARAFQLEGGAR